MNRKALRGKAFVKDASQGIAEIVISAYGNVDHDRDIVEVGACSKQIAGEYGPNPKGMLDHDWSMRSAVAKTLRWWEEADGTHVEAQYNLEKEIGRDAFSDLQFYGDDMEFSVGYEIKARRAPTAEEKAQGARQVITEWQINEWSHVMLGANSETRLVAAKAKTAEGARITQAKAVVGSYEYLSDRLEEALTEQFAAAWLYVRATFADHVVFAMERTDDMGDWHYAVYDVPFTITDDVYAFGEPTEVRTAEVIEPKTADAGEAKTTVTYNGTATSGTFTTTLANGGTLRSGTLTLVGSGGPEMVVPLPIKKGIDPRRANEARQIVAGTETRGLSAPPRATA